MDINQNKSKAQKPHNYILSEKFPVHDKKAKKLEAVQGNLPYHQGLDKRNC